MHRAGFGGESLTDIVGVLHDVIAQLFELGTQLALLRHQQRGRCGLRSLGRGRGRGRRGGGLRRRRGASAALLADDARRHDRLVDLSRAADRTCHELALHLRIVRGRALEPTLEVVAPVAAERVADHADPRTRCKWSGPALGSATPKRRPCWSEGIARRAVSTLAGSICAMMMPGSTSPSARISPQGSMISEWP